MDFIKHILVVSWLTKHCNKAIQFGISLSCKYNAEISVIHVIDTTWLQGVERAYVVHGTKTKK
jgi:hypothetical protein